MIIIVSKHAVRRYKQRIIKRKTTSGQKCTELIKAGIKSAYRIKKLGETESRANFGSYHYYSKDFIAVVQKNGCCLHVVTIKNYNTAPPNTNNKEVAI